MGSPDPRTPEAALLETVELVFGRARRLGEGALVCVDGPAGSGKTTWADRLAVTLRDQGDDVRLVHLDDTYDGWTGLPTVAARLARELLIPLAEGHAGSYTRYDWAAGRFAERQWVEPGDVVILEGVGSGDRLLDDFRTVLVWLEAPEVLCRERGIARDGAQILEHWPAWKAGESDYFAEQDLPLRADLRVRTD